MANNVGVICKGRLNTAGEKVPFSEIHGCESAFVLISEIAPFNDPNSFHFPLQNGARNYFQSRLGPNWAPRRIRGGGIMSKLFRKKTYRPTFFLAFQKLKGGECPPHTHLRGGDSVLLSPIRRRTEVLAGGGVGSLFKSLWRASLATRVLKGVHVFSFPNADCSRVYGKSSHAVVSLGNMAKIAQCCNPQICENIKKRIGWGANLSLRLRNSLADRHIFRMLESSS